MNITTLGEPRFPSPQRHTVSDRARVSSREEKRVTVLAVLNGRQSVAEELDQVESEEAVF